MRKVARTLYNNTPALAGDFYLPDSVHRNLTLMRQMAQAVRSRGKNAQDGTLCAHGSGHGEHIKEDTSGGR